MSTRGRPETLRARFAALQADNARLRRAVTTASRRRNAADARRLGEMRSNRDLSVATEAANSLEIANGRVALVSAHAETQIGHSDLRASEAINKALSIANGLLVVSADELEKLVEQRTASLMREVAQRHGAEEALRQGEKLQAMGQLTGGIAHDFNNMLQVIFTGVALLRIQNLTDVRRAELLDKIDYAAESATELTSRLLAFARKQAIRPKVIDLNARLGDMSYLLEPSLGSRVRVVVDFAGDLWPLVADPSQLEVTVLNLAMNARDAMLPEGGVLTLQTRNSTLQATPERAEGDYVSLLVKDTGRGMHPATVARVFEPFFTTKELGKGTGLGLAQVHGFAEQSGGDVSIESAPGHGTTISLHLPRPTAAALADAMANWPADAPQARVDPADHAAVKKVLVVEDNPELAGFTAAMLEQHGYTALHAANADEALALLDAGNQVDAVFSDVVMPGSMSGLQLAHALRSRYPKVAVLMATGYSQHLAESDGPAAIEVLSKPYRRNELEAALKRAFATAEHRLAQGIA